MIVDSLDCIVQREHMVPVTDFQLLIVLDILVERRMTGKLLLVVYMVHRLMVVQLGMIENCIYQLLVARIQLVEYLEE